MITSKTEHFLQIFLRVAIAATMLSAVADRFGLWGPDSSWGNWQNFEKYTGEVTSFLPGILSKFSAYAATFFEILLSVMLVSGFKTKLAAIGTGILLLMFALAMSVSLGIKAPFDYSVWVGSAAAFLLAAQQDDPLKRQRPLYSSSKES
ncbi:DoxX family protein [Spirosoma endbachense]|uniref:DoxX family membrane protein n=1 Tax=Spirosoma endbachense TaxID=2666025 RepID=A0A6P1VPY4_9BACT|nr:DoxX family protein [Spirosoma endbachense]QHV95321.1 DoxX family membrane protein [Spirosoma endbachense]